MGGVNEALVTVAAKGVWAEWKRYPIILFDWYVQHVSKYDPMSYLY